MLIIGAGGLAAQLFGELTNTKTENVAFWSETETKYPFIGDKFDILQSDADIVHYFQNISRSFLLCISGVENRKRLAEKFERLGGETNSFISPAAIISAYTTIGKGTIILAYGELEPGVTIGENCLVNKYAKIAHGTIIGSNCEIAPDVMITGEVTIGDSTYVGTRAMIFPKVQIGKNVIIAAGAIVKKNVPDNAVVAGEFAKVKFIQKVRTGNATLNNPAPENDSL